MRSDPRRRLRGGRVGGRSGGRTRSSEVFEVCIVAVAGGAAAAVSAPTAPTAPRRASADTERSTKVRCWYSRGVSTHASAPIDSTRTDATPKPLRPRGAADARACTHGFRSPRTTAERSEPVRSSNPTTSTTRPLTSAFALTSAAAPRTGPRGLPKRLPRTRRSTPSPPPAAVRAGTGTADAHARPDSGNERAAGSLAHRHDAAGGRRCGARDNVHRLVASRDIERRQRSTSRRRGDGPWAAGVGVEGDDADAGEGGGQDTPMGRGSSTATRGMTTASATLSRASGGALIKSTRAEAAFPSGEAMAAATSGDAASFATSPRRKYERPTAVSGG